MTCAIVSSADWPVSTPNMDSYASAITGSSRAGSFILHAADPNSDGESSHNLGWVGSQHGEQFVRLGLLLAEPKPPCRRRQDDGHAVVDRRYKLVWWPCDDG